MPGEKITARFKVSDTNRRWVPVNLTITDVDFTPPPPRIADLVVKIAEGERKLTYLGESRTPGQLDVTHPGGKFLGPVLRQNVVMTDTNSIIEVLNERAAVAVDRLYPLSDDYEIYGIWGFLDLVSGGLA